MRQKNIKLTLEYDGKDFAGWQYQPSRRTVQGELETAIRKLTGKKATLYAAGRTDAGVHAVGQVANFKTISNLSPKKYRDALNFYLPGDILVHRADEVPIDFHARYDAIYRSYMYSISRKRSVAEQGRCWEIPAELDFARLQAGAEHVRGEHDFSAFCVVSSQKANNRCLVYDSRWREEEHILKYEITADRFIHSMVRSLVGLMVRLGQANIDEKQFKQILCGGDHRAIGRVAPARGLCLIAVGY